MKNFSSELRDKAILLGWIAGLVLAAALLWSLSFPFRSACLMRSANRALALQGDPRQLSAPLPQQFASPAPLGCWYRLEGSRSLFYVFAVMRDGILVPCGAELSERGELTGIVPLGSHARKVIAQLPQGLIQVYARRIESAAARRAGGL